MLPHVPAAILLSALKPAEDRGVVVRLLNPTGAAVRARLAVGFPATRAIPVRLDETPDGADLPWTRGEPWLDVPAHGLRTVVLR